MKEISPTSPRVYVTLSAMLSSGIVDPKTAVTMSRTDVRRSDSTFSLLNLNHQVSVHFI